MSLFNQYRKDREIDQKDFPQEEFIDAVRQGGVAMERATGALIKYFRGYPLKFMKKFGLKKEDVLDIYTDSIMVVITYIRLGKFDESNTVSTYLYCVTHNKCVDLIRKKRNRKGLEFLEIPEAPIPDRSRGLLHELLISEAFHSVMDLLDSFKGKCKELILKWGFWGYSMSEIAESLDYKSADVVRTKKLRCLKRLRDDIGDDPHFPTPNF